MKSTGALRRLVIVNTLAKIYEDKNLKCLFACDARVRGTDMDIVVLKELD